MNSYDYFAQENYSTYKTFLERISEEFKQIMIQTLIGRQSMYEQGRFVSLQISRKSNIRF